MLPAVVAPPARRTSRLPAPAPPRTRRRRRGPPYADAVTPSAVPEPAAAAARRARQGVRAARRRGTDPGWPPEGLVLPAAGRRLLVGPANFAGQGWAWARAAEQLEDVAALCFTVRRGGFPFRSDLEVALARTADPRWQRAQQAWVCGGAFSHVLAEAARPLWGDRHGPDVRGELPVLARAGLDVALVAHGSDVRLPSAHARREPASPFGHVPSDRRGYVARLERAARRNLATFAAFDGPRFVSTPDLVDLVPGSTWLPTVVALDVWEGAGLEAGPPLLRERPVVLHAPTNPFLKGSDVVDAVMGRLDSEGLVTYRRVQGVAPQDMAALVAGADIVVDQLVLGLYSVAAIEAMAAGRVVIAHVPDDVRARTAAEASVPLPVVEATTSSLEAVVRELLAERSAAAAAAAAGPGFARAVHDGRRSAAVLAPWLLAP